MLQGYKDHPELWKPGDFSTEDREGLLQRIKDRAEIVWGDIAQTIGPFADSIEAAAPIGFISIDVDIYSATTHALRCLTSSPDRYNPAVSLYFDDVAFFFANEWCGELAAISEFNAQNGMRKIGIDRSLPGRRPASEAWYSHMYVCHVLDHDLRQKPRNRHELTLNKHCDFVNASHLY
jgi:hypothetical protein